MRIKKLFLTFLLVVFATAAVATVSTNPSRNEYTATAGQTVFNYTFKIYEDTDLNVYITPSGQEPDDSTDITTSYTVTNVGTDAGGTIILDSGTTLNDALTIVSNIPTNRTIDYQFNGDFRPNVVNNDFDRAVSLIKQSDDINARSLAFQQSFQGGQLTLPEPIAQNYLRWKTDLSGLENTELVTTGTLVAGDVVEQVNGVLGLTLGDTSSRKTYSTGGFYNDTTLGGGLYLWDTTTNKTLANGGTIIDPDTTGGFDGTTSTLAAFLAAQGGGAGSGCWLRVETGTIDPTWFGAVGDGSTDNFGPIQAAITAVKTAGGGTVSFPDGADVYNVDCAAVALTLSSNTTVDLGGNTIHRTDQANRQMMRNENYFAGGTDVEIYVKNGTITGLGTGGSSNDQGSAVGLWDVDGWGYENLITNDTLGDGLQYRECDNGYMRNIRVGTFGRNGISPTSGLDNHFLNVDVVGPPLPDTTNGKGIDVENNISHLGTPEVSRMFWNGVRTADATFIDFHSLAGEDFAHEVQMVNCIIGPGFNALRFISSNGLIARNVSIGPTNTLLAAGANGSALQITDVDGINVVGPIIGVGTSTASNKAIDILGTVENTTIINPQVDPDFVRSLLVVGTARLNNSILSGLDGTMYLSGHDNMIRESDIPALTLNGADTIDNVFAVSADIGAVTLADSAVLSDQFFGSDRGSRSLAFYSGTEVVSTGPTYDMTVPLPDATGAANGRSVTIIANYSHKGSATNWANLITTIVYGDSGTAEQTVVSSTNGGSGAITVQSVGLDNCVLRLTFTAGFSGNFSVTVIG